MCRLPMQAYYTLASKRFVDNVCMALDDQILGKLCSKMQQQCYAFVHDEARLARQHDVSRGGRRPLLSSSLSVRSFVPSTSSLRRG